MLIHELRKLTPYKSENKFFFASSTNVFGHFDACYCKHINWQPYFWLFLLNTVVSTLYQENAKMNEETRR